MRLPPMVRSLTPLGWAVVLGLALIVAGCAIKGLRWDPFGREARRLERAEQAARQGQAEAVARHMEAAGHAEQLRRQGAVSATLKSVAATTAQTQAEARRADDATNPLDQERLDRLRAHDRQLCAHAAGLGGCAATAEPARTGGAGL